MSNVRNEYLPGVCNIGVAERRMRRRAGWIGLVATVILWILFIAFGAPGPWRLFLFVPAMLGASGFLQAGMSFCVNFGMRGAQNFGDEIGKITQVEDTEHRRRDRLRSLQIIVYAALISAVFSLLGLASGLMGLR